jgi:hypothetical protein
MNSILQSLTAKHVTQMVEDTQQFLDHLLRAEEIPLSNIAPIYKLLQQNKRNIADELNIAYVIINCKHFADYAPFNRREFYFSAPHGTKRDVEKLLQSLQEALELLQYSNELDYLLNALKKYGLCQSSIDTLQTLRVPETVKLREVGPLLNKIRNVLGGFPAEYLCYFAMATDVEELLLFFIQQHDKFEDTVRFLNSHLQGYEFSQNVLNSLLSARNLLEPLLNVLQKRNEETNIKDLCNRIRLLLSNIRAPSGIRNKLDEVRYLLQHLPQIRVWFANTGGLTLETLLPLITQLVKTGQYEVRYFCCISKKTAHKRTESIAITS